MGLVKRFLHWREERNEDQKAKAKAFAEMCAANGPHQSQSDATNSAVHAHGPEVLN